VEDERGVDARRVSRGDARLIHATRKIINVHAVFVRLHARIVARFIARKTLVARMRIEKKTQ
jgi:hypothetical protein